ncbi:MAG: zinc ribbon domain-containing protein [Candidatus Cloacimonetes bacterium]|nr:zinc ribbon domain-containing protein [Candidatus Cloacimonadota bacterium]
MPIYEYKCNSCEDTFEIMQSMSAKDLTSCKLCNEEDIRKIIHPVGSIYKGNGFYSTEYRSDSYKKDAEKAKSA